MSLDPSQEVQLSGDDDEGSAVDDEQFKARQQRQDTDEEDKSSHSDTSKASIQQEENSEAGESTKGSGGTATSIGSFDSEDSLNVEGISLAKRGAGEEEEHQVRLISPNLLEAQPYLVTASTPPLSTSMPSKRNTPDPRATPSSNHEETATIETVGEVVEEVEAPKDRQYDIDENHQMDGMDLVDEKDSMGGKDAVDEKDHSEESQVHQPEPSTTIKDETAVLDQEEPLPELQESKAREEINTSLSVTSLEGSTDLYASDVLEDKPEDQSFHKEEKNDPILSTHFDEAEQKSPEVVQEINVYNTVDTAEIINAYENKEKVFLRTEEAEDLHKDDDSFYASAEENLEDKVPGKHSSIRFQMDDSDMEEQTVEIVDDVYSETYAPRERSLDERVLYGHEQVYKDNLDDEDDEHISSVSEHEGDSHETYVKKPDRRLFIYTPNIAYTLGDSFSQYEKLTRRSLGDTDEVLSGYQDNSSVVSDVCSPRLESHRQTSLSRLKSKMPKFSTAAYSFRRLKPQVTPPTPPSTPWTVFGDFGGYHLNGQNSHGSKDKKVSLF